MYIDWITNEMREQLVGFKFGDSLIIWLRSLKCSRLIFGQLTGNIDRANRWSLLIDIVLVDMWLLGHVKLHNAWKTNLATWWYSMIGTMIFQSGANIGIPIVHPLYGSESQRDAQPHRALGKIAQLLPVATTTKNKHLGSCIVWFSENKLSLDQNSSWNGTSHGTRAASSLTWYPDLSGESNVASTRSTSET